MLICLLLFNGWDWDPLQPIMWLSLFHLAYLFKTFLFISYNAIYQYILAHYDFLHGSLILDFISLFSLQLSKYSRDHLVQLKNYEHIQGFSLSKKESKIMQYLSNYIISFMNCLFTSLYCLLFENIKGVS